MENQIAIQTVLDKKNQYNLVIPFVESQQINPYYKLNVSILKVDTNLAASEIYKVGTKNIGRDRNGKDQWVDAFALTKPFLQRLATEAGIQFSPGTGDVTRVDVNTWKASAYGALRLPDGTVRTSNNFKVIDLLTEEQKYRIGYEEKAKNGITDIKVAKAIEKKYSGKWNASNSVFFIDEADRRKYIENSLLEAMAQLRANAPQKAATGAILRVIRDLTGIKATYTIEELEKPFAVARMAFSPDYNDPFVKQMMLQQCMQSTGNLFGNQLPYTQTISIPQNEPDDDVLPADVYEEEPNEVEEITEIEEDRRPNDFQCDKCGAVITEKAWDYSIGKFGRPLCFKCQKEEPK